MNYGKKLIKGTALVFIMSVLAAFVGYLLRMYLARNLTIAEYGLFYAVFGFIGLFALFKDLGLGQALAKFIPEFVVKKQYSKIKSAIVSSLILQFISSTVVSVFLVLFAKWLSQNYFKIDVAYPVLLLSIAFYWLSFVENTYGYVMQGFQKMKYFSWINFLKMTLIFAMVFVLFLFKKSVVFVALSYLLYYILSIFFYLPFIKKAFPKIFSIKFRWNQKLSKDLFLFGIPIMISLIGWLVLGYTDTAVLTLFRSLEEVGMYNVALPTASLLFYFTSAISIVLLPMVSEMYARKYHERLINGIRLIHNYSLFFIIPFAIMMFVFPEAVINLLFGSKYFGAVEPLRILAIGSIFYTLAYVNLSIISGIGKPKKVSEIVLSAALFNLVGNFILIPKYGMIGAAITTAIGFFIMLILSLIYLSKEINIRIDAKDFLKICFNGFVFLAIIYLFKFISVNMYLKIILACFVGFGVYFALGLLFKTIDIKDIKGMLGYEKA